MFDLFLTFHFDQGARCKDWIPEGISLSIFLKENCLAKKSLKSNLQAFSGIVWSPQVKTSIAA